MYKKVKKKKKKKIKIMENEKNVLRVNKRVDVCKVEIKIKCEQIE